MEDIHAARGRPPAPTFTTVPRAHQFSLLPIFFPPPSPPASYAGILINNVVNRFDFNSPCAAVVPRDRPNRMRPTILRQQQPQLGRNIGGPTLWPHKADSTPALSSQASIVLAV